MACSKPFTHRLQLEKLCRICGQKTRGKQFRVQLYHEEILTVYKYNLTNDSLDLHPTNICNRCRCRLGRATKSKESTVVDQFQNRHKLLVFEPHKSNKSCLICQSQRGRPKKIPPADNVQECGSSSSTDSCSDETGNSIGFKVGNNDEPPAKK